MKNVDQITEDYSRQPVPDSETVSGFKIATVLIGGVITLPIFLVGAQLGGALGLARGAAVFAITGIVLTAIALASGIIAARTRLSTWMIIRYAFGQTGAKWVAALIGITVLGWYGVTLDVFARTIGTMVLDLTGVDLDRRVYLVTASILMVLVALFGFKGLERLSKLAVPLMLGVMVLLAYTAINQHGLSVPVTATMSLAEGISACVGGFIVGITLFPDICRYARSDKDAAVAASLGFALGVPLVLLLAAIPVILTGASDIISVILISGFGLAGLALLLFATWTTNAYNLYSSSLVFATIAQRQPKWKLVIYIGVIGTFIALLPILDHFLLFLNVLAIVIPPVAGIYLCDYFCLHKNNRDRTRSEPSRAYNPIAFAAWGAGSLIGYFASQSLFTLTTVPALDALVGSFVCYLIFTLAQQKFGAS